MKILFKIISVLLYFNSVSLVQMYYIYDDNPTIGFVSVDGGTYMQTGMSVGKPGKKQQFTGSYSNHKYHKMNNEHVVDSHFKVMKTKSKQDIPAALDNGKPISHEAVKTKAQRIADEYRNTEAPKQWHQKPQHQQMANIANSKQNDINQNPQFPNNIPVRGDHGSKTKEATRTQSSNKQQIQPIRAKAVNVDYSNLMMPRNKDSGTIKKNQDVGRSQRTQDTGRSQRQKDKSAYVEMNVRKASSDPQKKVLLNNNRQSTSLSVLTSQDKRQKLPTSMMMDKTLHKANGIAHDHNMQVMSRVLEAMTQEISDRRHKKGEYVNSDTEKHLDIIYEKSKRSVVADNMRKYIGKDKIGKDLRNQPQRQNSALARIGSHEDSLEQDDTPYAVFYRMNPETLDRQEGFMIMRSLDAENGSRDVASKEKRIHTAFMEDTENMKSNKKSKQTGGGTLHRKKMKNFFNYRNH